MSYMQAGTRIYLQADVHICTHVYVSMHASQRTYTDAIIGKITVGHVGLMSVLMGLLSYWSKTIDRRSSFQPTTFVCSCNKRNKHHGMSNTIYDHVKFQIHAHFLVIIATEEIDFRKIRNEGRIDNSVCVLLPVHEAKQLQKQHEHAFFSDHKPSS